MPKVIEIPFKPTNQIWKTYKHFPYKAHYAVGELVDNSTQSFFDNQKAVKKALATEGVAFQVSIDFDPQTRTLVVSDNAMGMDLKELKRAVQLAAPPANTSGRSEFGMGLKTAASWLGNKWSVRTKMLGDTHEYSFTIDIGRHAASNNESLSVTEKPVDDTNAHYTIVKISDVRTDFQRRALGKIKQHLAQMYARDIKGGILTLLWNGEQLVPTEKGVLETSEEVLDKRGEKRVKKTVWRKEINFKVKVGSEKKQVTGWMCLADPSGRSEAGFDLVRRGRVVMGRPTGYRPERIFGVDRNDLINQRLYGELNLDEFPVNHLKDDFLWDEWGEEFDDQLQKVCAEYVKFAREYRSSKGKTSVPPTVVQATNDDLAASLSTEEMAAKIHLLEEVGPVPAVAPEIRAAEAEALRDQAIEPRIIDLQGKKYRIYHPIGMKSEQPYVRYEAPNDNTIDIFINDNHPYVGQLGNGAGTAEKYQVHAHACVQDAIAIHLLTCLGTEILPELFLQYKDQLLRVMKS